VTITKGILVGTGMFLFILFGFLTFQGTVFVSEVDAVQESVLSSERNHQTMDLLAASRNTDPARGGGQIAVVEGIALVPTPHTANVDIGDRPQSDQISIYVVREGDTLTQIGEMFGVSVNTIIWGSDLKRGAHIEPGQILTILPVSGLTHEVEDGDTLSKIAKKYEADLEEISIFNDIDPYAALEVGSEIIVPGAHFPSAVAHTHITRSSPALLFDGYYIRPISGTITQGIHGFNAIDFGAPVGTPIVAAAEGSVIISRSGGWNGGYGSYVVIRHGNGTQTLYAHNSGNIVYAGQYVNQGQVIGYSGNTGRSTGPHLHFEVRGAVNPFAY